MLITEKNVFIGSSLRVVMVVLVLLIPLRERVLAGEGDSVQIQAFCAWSLAILRADPKGHLEALSRDATEFIDQQLNLLNLDSLVRVLVHQRFYVPHLLGVLVDERGRMVSASSLDSQFKGAIESTFLLIVKVFQRKFEIEMRKLETDERELRIDLYLQSLLTRYDELSAGSQVDPRFAEQPANFDRLAGLHRAVEILELLAIITWPRFLSSMARKSQATEKTLAFATVLAHSLVEWNTEVFWVPILDKFAFLRLRDAVRQCQRAENGPAEIEDLGAASRALDVLERSNARSD
jgi:hypothetical protein